uniref:hypothetical protein n=1 Tax=Klebsiella pneumoniae TaxID=573 RepID=UPI00155DAB71|nr:MULTISPECIES: hypothetical protein [Enterobacteriaceae]
MQPHLSENKPASAPIYHNGAFGEPNFGTDRNKKGQSLYLHSLDYPFANYLIIANKNEFRSSTELTGSLEKTTKITNINQ